MVPGSPVAAVECFKKQRAVLTRSEVSTLAAQLNALRHLPSNTPMCLALGPSYSLFFTYPSGAIQRVEVPTICGPVSNGRLIAERTTDLIDVLRGFLEH
jgi:hypothetical protein